VKAVLKIIVKEMLSNVVHVNITSVIIISK